MTKNLRPFLLRAGEDTRPYEKSGSYVFVGEGVPALPFFFPKNFLKNFENRKTFLCSRSSKHQKEGNTPE